MIQVGDEVLVQNGRSGSVRYVGETEFAAGVWCGIEMHDDGQLGKNDGSVKGVRYFELVNRVGQYGLFVKVENVVKKRVEKEDDGRMKLLLNRLQDKILVLNASIEEFTIKEGDYLARIEELTRLTDELQLKNAESNLQIESLTIEVDRNRKLEELVLEDIDSADESNLRKLVKKLEMLLKDTSDQYESSLLENEELFQVNSKMESLIVKSNDKIEYLTAMIDDLNKELELVTNSKELLERLTNENSNLKSDVESKSREMESLRKELEYQNSVVKVYSEMESELNLGIGELQENWKQNLKEIVKIREENQSLSNNIASLSKENSSLLTKLSEFENSIQAKVPSNNSITREKLLEKLFISTSSNEESRYFVTVYATYLKILYAQLLPDPKSNDIINALSNKLLLFFISKIFDAASTYEELNMPSIKLQNGSNIFNLDTWINYITNGINTINFKDYSHIISLLENNVEIDKNLELLSDIVIFSTSNFIPKMLACLESNSMITSDKVTILYKSCLQVESSVINRIKSIKSELYEEDKLLMDEMTISKLLTSMLPILHNMIKPIEDKSVLNELQFYLQFLLKMFNNADNLKLLPKVTKAQNDSTLEKPKNVFTTREKTSNNKIDANINNIQETINEKEKEFTELTIKLKILNNKLALFDSNEKSLKNAEIEKASLNEKNENLTSTINNLEEELLDIRLKLENEKISKYFKFKQPVIQDLLKEKENVEKLTLVTEISNLQEIIKNVPHENKSDESELAWLDDSSSLLRKTEFVADPYFGKINSITNFTKRFVESIHNVNLSHNNSKKNHTFDSYETSSSRQFNTLKNALENQFT